MALIWVLADLADKAGVLFGTQGSPHLDSTFEPYYGVLMLTLLSPASGRPKPTMSVKLIVVTVLVIAVVFVLPLALIRFSDTGPLRTQFALDLIFATTLPFMMWRIPKHDLEVVERPEQGTDVSPVTC